MAVIGHHGSTALLGELVHPSLAGVLPTPPFSPFPALDATVTVQQTQRYMLPKFFPRKPKDEHGVSLPSRELCAFPECSEDAAAGHVNHFIQKHI